MLYLLFAAYLLSLEPGDGLQEHATPEIMLAVQTIALQWEILDPREVRYILVLKEDFAKDMATLQQRRKEMADAPPLSDSFRYPPRDAVSDYLTFNRAHQQYLRNGQSVYLWKWHEYEAAIRETETLYTVWDWVRDSTCEYYYITVRRNALRNLREMIGKDMYHSGQLPPFAPFWRFERAN